MAISKKPLNTERGEEVSDTMNYGIHDKNLHCLVKEHLDSILSDRKSSVV